MACSYFENVRACRRPCSDSRLVRSDQVTKPPSVAEQRAVEVRPDLRDLLVLDAEAQGDRHVGPVGPKVVGQLTAILAIDHGLVNADAVDGLPLEKRRHLADAVQRGLRRAIRLTKITSEASEMRPASCEMSPSMYWSRAF